MQTPGNAQSFNYVHVWLWKSLTITLFRQPVLKSGWSPCMQPSQAPRSCLERTFSLSLIFLTFSPLSRTTTTTTMSSPGIGRPALSSHGACMPYTESSNSQPWSPTFPSTLSSPTSSYVLSRPASSSSVSSSTSPLTPQSPFSAIKGARGKVSPESQPPPSNSWQT